MAPLSSEAERHLRHLFRPGHIPRIAVLGAHPNRTRAAWSVPAYLERAGAQLRPINPRHSGTVLFGQPVVAELGQLTEPLDCVVVFRRSSALPDHLDELQAARPAVVWLQLGVRHEAVATSLEQHGIAVVQDRCIKVDHARYIGFYSQ